MDSSPTDPVLHPPMPECLARADHLYQTGDLAAALALYRQMALELESAAPPATGPAAPTPTGTESSYPVRARDLAHAHSRIGAILAQQGQLDAAETELERAIAQDPTLPSAHSNLGNVCYGRGRFAAALAQYEIAERLDPENPIYLHNQHAAFKKLGRLDRAVSVIKRAHDLERKLARREARDRWRQTRQRTGCVLPTLLLSLAVVTVVLGILALG